MEVEGEQMPQDTSSIQVPDDGNTWGFRPTSMSTPLSVTQEPVEALVRKSGRTRNKPSHMADYVMKVCEEDK